MPSRIPGGFVQAPTSADRRDLSRLNDRLETMYRQNGAIGGAQVQVLLNEAMKDGKLTQSEAQYLATAFQANAHLFTPDGAATLNQFLGGYGQSFNYQQPMAPVNNGWVPGGVSAGVPPAMGYDPPEIKTLRQAVGQLLSSGKMITGSDAQSLVQRAMSNSQFAPQGLQVLADTLNMNRANFSPEAAIMINNAIMSNPQVGYMPNAQPYGGFSNPALNPSPTFSNPALNPNSWGYNPGTYNNPYNNSGFDTGPRPMTRSDARELGRLRDNFTQMLMNDGMVTPNEVQSLLSQATSSQLTNDKVQLLAQGFRDNQGRFTGDAANMMANFLRQFGVY